MTSAFGSGAQPPARRDNGLRADQFVALADVDPRLGEHLLDLLRLAEIPAYLEPSTDPRVAVRYRSSGPVERLYVHADQRQEARAVVVAAAREAGESAETVTETPPPLSSSRRDVVDVLKGIDTDAEFARIVSGFSSSSPSTSTPRGRTVAPDPTVAADRAVAADPGVSVDPGVSADPGVSVDPGTSADPGVSADLPADLPTELWPVNRHGIDPADLVRDTDDGASPVTPAQLDAAAEAAAQTQARAERDADLAEDEDDHFHPPTAPPFPVPTANTVAAVLLLILGVLVLVRGDVFGLDSTTSFPASILLMLGASALIIRGLRDQPDPDEEPEDDGAEV